MGPFVSSLPHPGFVSNVEDVRDWLHLLYSDHILLVRAFNSAIAEFRKVQGSALTAENAGTVNSGDATTDDVIEANRTRIAEIEVILRANALVP